MIMWLLGYQGRVVAIGKARSRLRYASVPNLWNIYFDYLFHVPHSVCQAMAQGQAPKLYLNLKKCPYKLLVAMLPWADC